MSRSLRASATPWPHRLTGGLVVWALLCGAAAAEGAAEVDLARAVADAAPGDVLQVPAGVHRGGLVIDRPLTLVGRPGAVIDGGGSGEVVRILAADVTLRGLTIRGTGTSLDKENAGVTVLAPRARLEGNELSDVLFGVYLKQAPDSVIRGNRIGGKTLPVQRRGDGIRLWHSPRTLIEDNVVERSRDVVIWFSDEVQLRRNRVAHGRYGLHFMYSNANVVEHNDLRHNSVGAFLMYSKKLVLRDNVLAYNRGPSGYGIGLKDMDGVRATDNLVFGNRVGIYLDNSPGSVDVRDRYQGNVLAFNDIGVAFQPAVRRNDFVGNAFLENLEQVAVLDAGEVRGNGFTVDGVGNYWSDYAGYDLDGDGVGDLPHRPVSLFENLMDQHPKLRLFLHSPAQQAVELAARAFPAIKPRPKFTDEAPSLRPPTLSAAADVARFSWQLGTLALVLLLAPLGAVAWGRRGAGPAARARRSEPEEVAMDRRAAMLRVRELTKRYGRLTAVDRFSLDVAAGEAVALWGRNGAGKTSVIRCVLGLQGCEGRVEVGGIDLARDGKRLRRLIGYVPQELALYADLRTSDTLEFYGALKRVPRDRVPEVLREVGLDEHAAKPVAALSGGMKQRLALAVALLADPPLLMLDEMTSNLDARARTGFLALLQRLKQQGKTLVYISHRLDEVEALADRVVVMEAGRAVLECAPRRLAEELGLRTSLKLRVEPETVERAAGILRDGGFTVQRNGTGFWIDVQPDAKLAPIELLLGSDVRVLDFELGSDTTPLSERGANHGTA